MEHPSGPGVINLSLGSSYVSAFNTAIANAVAAGLAMLLRSRKMGCASTPCPPNRGNNCAIPVCVCVCVCVIHRTLKVVPIP